MSAPTLSDLDISSRARELAGSLGDLRGVDAVKVLARSVEQILAESDTAEDPGLTRPPALFNPRLLRRRRALSKIERDPELEAFINNLPGGPSIEGIAALCRAKFGTDRSPSKSSVHRYITKLRRLHQEGVMCHE